MNLRWSGTKAAEGLVTRHSGGPCTASLAACTLKLVLCWAASSLQGRGVLGDWAGHLSVKGCFVVSLVHLTSHPNLRGGNTEGLPNTAGVGRERYRSTCLICVSPVAIINEIVPEFIFVPASQGKAAMLSLFYKWQSEAQRGFSFASPVTLREVVAV